MSLVKTVKEWIEDLQKLNPETQMIGNLYTGRDLVEGVESYVEDGDSLADLTDGAVIEKFRGQYDSREEEAYFESCSDVAYELEHDEE